MTPSIPYMVRRNSLNIMALGAAILLGIVLGLIVPTLENQSLYRLVAIAVGALIGFGVMVSSNAKRILLLILVLSIPLNLSFSPFGDIPPHEGGAPPGIRLFLYDFALLGLIILWVIDVLLNKKRIYFTYIDAAAVAFVFWVFLSIYNSSDIEVSLYEVARLIKFYLLAHVVGASIEDRRTVRDLLIVFVMVALIQAAIASLQYFMDFDVGGLGFTVGDTRRVSGTVGWPNTLGGYLATILCLPVALWLCQVGGKWRPLILVGAVLGAVPLVLTFSRGSWVAFGAGVIVIFVLGWYASWIRTQSLARLLILVGLAAIAGLIFQEQIAARNAQDTLEVRGLLNEIAINMVSANPIAGIGINTFVANMRFYDTTGVSYIFPFPVHNYYLLIAAETGLVGISLFFLLLVAIAHTGRHILKTKDRFLSATMVGVAGGFTAILVSNIADVHLIDDVMYSLFWFLIGLTMALRRLASTSSAQHFSSVR